MAAPAMASETDTPQFQAEATFNSAFEGGSFSGWAGFLWQEQEILPVAASLGVDDDPTTLQVFEGMPPSAGMAGGDVESVGWNVGAQVSAQGFSVTGQYYSGEALGYPAVQHRCTGWFRM